MLNKTWKWKHDHCEYCGQFINYSNYASYIPPGNANDLEPDDPHFICLRCWDNPKNTRPMAWGGITVVRNGEYE